MHDAFGTVIWIVCGVGAIFAVVGLILSGRTWQELGRDHLLMGRDSQRDPKAGSSAAMLERDAEIRQLLQARNLRRQRRGEPPLDVEAELNKLTAPALDDELRQEIRDLVVARNHRRTRAGKPPLDIEAEIEREIKSLGDLGTL
jgi:hypothetical protein